MELYQAGYYREGLQGSNAGWHIVSPSTDMSQTARQGMAGLGSKIASIVTESSYHPNKAMGIFSTEDQYYYILHVNKHAMGLDSRGVSYTHGYCCNREDFYELCQNPARIFGVRDDNFQDEYLQEGRPYPVVNDLTYDDMDLSAILKKYNLTQENYKQLLWGILATLDGYSPSFCIRVNCDTEEIPTAYKELMYAVMMGLPYQLRIKLTSYVDAGTVAKVYVSNHCESSAFYDVETGECVSAKDKLSKFSFTRLYGTYTVDTQQFQDILKIFSSFVDKVYKNPLKNVSCERIESAYQAKKNSGVDEDAVVELLNYLSGQNLNYGLELNNYLKKILQILVTRQFELNDNRIENILDYNSSITADEEYLALYYSWKAQNFVKDGEKSFVNLWDIYQKNHVHFTEILSRIIIISPEYKNQFYEHCYLPRVLGDLGQLKKCVEGEQTDFDDAIFNRVFSCQFEKCIKKEYDKCVDFYSLTNVYNNCIAISDAIYPQYAICKKNQLIMTEMWKHFKMCMFRVNEIDEYKKYNVVKCAEIAKANGEQSGAIDVTNAINLAEGNINVENEDVLKDIIFNQAYFENSKECQKFVSIVQKHYLANRGIRKLDFDLLLILYFDCKKGTFNMAKLATDVITSCRQTEVFTASAVTRNIDNSELLSVAQNRVILLEALESAVKDKSQNQKVVMNLRQYYRYMRGKSISDFSSGNENSFLHSIQRVVVLSFAVLTIAFSLVCFKRYVFDLKWSIVFAGIAGALTLCGFIVRIVLDGGISEFLDETGISTITDLFILLAIIIGFGGISTGIYLWGNFVVKTILMIIIVFVVIGITTAYFLLEDE